MIVTEAGVIASIGAVTWSAQRPDAGEEYTPWQDIDNAGVGWISFSTATRTPV